MNKFTKILQDGFHCQKISLSRCEKIQRQLIRFFHSWLQQCFFAFLLFCLFPFRLSAAEADLVVAQDGTGQFRTITEAFNALPMYPYRRTVIFINDGIYEEKIRITQNYVTLRGESRDGAIIRFSQLRSDWDAHRDWIGPAVVNIHADDIILDNLTIENSQPEIGPHAFAVYGDGTRTILMNCNVISKGGDTVSLWNYKNGLYYHSNCYFEGAVDFVCPRGWCYITGSRFFEVKETAALWHDGHYDGDQKLVIRNSSFDGVPGFCLGRHHYDAQFYLLGCRFSENLLDRPIYPELYRETEKNNPDYFGERIYFYQCEKEGKPFTWYADNLPDASGSPKPSDVTAAWTFGGRWDPESTKPVQALKAEIAGKSVILTFSEIVTVRGEPVFQNSAGRVFRIRKERYNDIDRLTFLSDDLAQESDLAGDLVLENGAVIASRASVSERILGPTFRIPL